MIKICKIGILLLFGMLVGVNWVKSEALSVSNNFKGKRDFFVSDSTGNYRLVIPFAFYSEETNWGFGLSGGYYSSKGDNKITSIQGNLVYTLNKQIGLTVSPMIFGKNQDFFYSGRIAAHYYPDKFFGIGRNTPDSLEEDFTSKNFFVLIQRQRVLFDVLMVGLQAQIGHFNIADITSNGLLAKGDITGSGNYRVMGLGLLFTWENRENRFYPKEGEFLKVTLMVNSKIFASELNYTELDIDFRKYYPIIGEHTLAFQFISKLTWGDVPFQLMPMLGGQDIMRGYYKGRYRDYAMVSMQTEYRFPMYRWLKGTFFGSVGDVAPYFDQLDFTKFKTSFGGGLRLKVNPARVNIRFDIAYTGKRKPAYYFTISEAF